MRYPFPFRLLHWVLTVSLVILLLSGLSLHAVARPSWSLFDGRLPGWFWPGRIHLVHLWAAMVFLPSLVTVVVVTQRQWPRRTNHRMLLLGGLTMIFTGLLLLNPLGPPVVSTLVRLVHDVTAVMLAVALGWHAVEGVTRWRRCLVAAFHPWAEPHWRWAAWFLPLALVGACLILNGLPTRPAGRDLVARRVSSTAGDLAALPWNEASPLVIELANGMGFERGRTQVTLRALHDGEELGVLAEWADPIEDRQYMPWQKTAGGWKRLATDEKDESRFYEDKFALIFPPEAHESFARFGCAIYCHAGGGRAYGYKCSDRIVDVWHWKSTRTDPVGQVDDKYWWKPDFTKGPVGRYGDPKTGGGCETNASKDKTHPAFLPDDPANVRQGIIPTAHAVPYSAAQAAKIPIDTLVPGIVAAPLEGDQGDVTCVSRHEAGRWRLYIRRKLDTGSQYDARFVPGGAQLFGCAAFDRTSKRHAYDLAVYRLVLDP